VFATAAAAVQICWHKADGPFIAFFAAADVLCDVKGNM
jgi:hypothetical protein